MDGVVGVADKVALQHPIDRQNHQAVADLAHQRAAGEGGEQKTHPVGQLAAQIGGEHTEQGDIDAPFHGNDQNQHQRHITNYSASVYSNLSLSFASAIPQGTTILLMDKSEAKTTWWSYTATGSVSTVALGSFTRMGSNDPFTVKNGTLQYQFIVDFAETGNSPATGSMNMTLQAAKSDANAQPLEETATVSLSQAQSITATASAQGMTATVTMAISETEGLSTKWNNHAAALVLTPISSIPPDARLRVDGGTQLVVLHRNADGKYVIPRGMVMRDQVRFELLSDLLPEGAATYTFRAEWKASETNSASAVANGTTLAAADVTFTKQPQTRPSLKVTGTDHLFRVGEMMTVDLQYTLDEVCEIGAQLQRMNENGGYSNTGLDLKVGNSGAFNVSLAGQNPGDFRLYVTIRRGQQVVAQVSYYFILQS